MRNSHPGARRGPTTTVDDPGAGQQTSTAAATQNRSVGVAVRIEVDALYVHLNQNEDLPGDAARALLDLLPRLLAGIQERTGQRIVLRQAYADFRRLPQHLMHALNGLGIDPILVPSKPKKSTVDMAICIEVTDAIHWRSDITAEVIGAGDSDYAPLVKRLKCADRPVWLVAFGSTISEALRQAVGSDRIIDAADYIPHCTESSASAATTAERGTHTVSDDVWQVSRDVLCFAIEEHVLKRRHLEIWLGPFKADFLQHRPEITPPTFHEAVTLLGAEGAVVKRRRPAREEDRRDFAVIVPDPDHELVRAIVGERTWPSVSQASTGSAA